MVCPYAIKAANFPTRFRDSVAWLREMASPDDSSFDSARNSESELHASHVSEVEAAATTKSIRHEEGNDDESSPAASRKPLRRSLTVIATKINRWIHRRTSSATLTPFPDLQATQPSDAEIAVALRQRRAPLTMEERRRRRNSTRPDLIDSSGLLSFVLLAQLTHISAYSFTCHLNDA